LKTRAHVVVIGRVQGVFFRRETEENARLHNVTGWVRNLPDGRVEAILEGEEEAVNSVVEFCKRGPPGAYVIKSEVKWEHWRGEFSNFQILY
jgi:acylphosphatase